MMTNFEDLSVGFIGLEVYTSAAQIYN